MPTWNAGGIVSNDDVTADFYSDEPRSGPRLNVFQQNTLTAADVVQQNNTLTINANDARTHSVLIDRDGDEALSEYYLNERYSDLLRRYYERTRAQQNAVVGRSNTSVSDSDLLSKNKIRELIREVLIEEGIILNKPQKAIEAEEVDELFEQRGINDES